MGKIKVAFATGIHSEFGYKGALPWQGHPNQHEDFKAFKEFTKDCVVVMGKHTFASLPFRLPNRKNIVIGSEKLTAKNGDVADEYVNGSIFKNEGSLRGWLYVLSKWENKDVVVIGGAGLIHEVLYFADEVMYTRFHQSYNADISMDVLPKYIGTVVGYKSFGVGESFMDITYFKRNSAVEVG